eukprot:PhM_4_TR4086/c3_g1_i1/m.35127/K20196/KIF3B; kinesin family member 3B
MGKKEKSDAAENIKVLVRMRPISKKELDNGHTCAVDLNLAESTVTVNHVCGAPDRWTFDAVVNNTFTQKDVFTQFIQPLVDSVLDGFNATVFAYGQSGSGKTHTMTGDLEDPEKRGIIPRTFNHIFNHVRTHNGQTSEHGGTRHYNVYCSFLELYNGKVRDLLSRSSDSLQIKENKDKTFFVHNLMMPEVKFEDDLVRQMEEGTERRRVAATELNADSSRSHSIFSVIIESVETSDDGVTKSISSKLNLVDLAGSERQSKTGAVGDTLKEGCNINLSLSALGTVIDTIVKGKGHVPFRSSPLTMLLKDSLGGSSKTVMFANIGPAEHNVSETVSTLRFADRAKQIKNKPVVMMDSKDQKIAELQDAVNELKDKLKRYEEGGMGSLENENEALKERLGELQISVDEARQEAERAGTDLEFQTQRLRADLDASQKHSEELQHRITQLESEKAFADCQAQDELAQRRDMLRVLCEAAGHDVVEEMGVSEVQQMLRTLRRSGGGEGGGGPALSDEDISKLQREVTMLKDKVAGSEKELQRTVRVRDQMERDLDQAVARMEKMKARIEKDKEARKTAAAEHTASLDALKEKHLHEVQQLRQAVEHMERHSSFTTTSFAIGGYSNLTPSLSDIAPLDDTQNIYPHQPTMADSSEVVPPSADTATATAGDQPAGTAAEDNGGNVSTAATRPPPRPTPPQQHQQQQQQQVQAMLQRQAVAHQ